MGGGRREAAEGAVRGPAEAGAEGARTASLGRSRERRGGARLDLEPVESGDGRSPHVAAERRRTAQRVFDVSLCLALGVHPADPVV